MPLQRIIAGGVQKTAMTAWSAAVTRAEAMNADWDACRAGERTGTQRSKPRQGSLARAVHELRQTAEWRDKSKATREQFEYVWSNLIGPHVGDANIERGITPQVCEALYAAWREEGSIHRAQKGMRWLRYLLNREVRLGRLRHNAAHSVRVKTPKPRRVLWTQDQVRAVAQAARDLGSPDLEVPVLAAYDTGIRPVDLRGLRWGDLIRRRTELRTGEDRPSGRDGGRSRDGRGSLSVA